MILSMVLRSSESSELKPFVQIGGFGYNLGSRKLLHFERVDLTPAVPSAESIGTGATSNRRVRSWRDNVSPLPSPIPSAHGPPWNAGKCRKSPLDATGAAATILPPMSEAEKQFFLTRAASMNRRGAKSNFLSVSVNSILYRACGLSDRLRLAI